MSGAFRASVHSRRIACYWEAHNESHGNGYMNNTVLQHANHTLPTFPKLPPDGKAANVT